MKKRLRKYPNENLGVSKRLYLFFHKSNANTVKLCSYAFLVCALNFLGPTVPAVKPCNNVLLVHLHFTSSYVFRAYAQFIPLSEELFPSLALQLLRIIFCLQLL